MHTLIIEDEPLIALTIEDALRTCGSDTFDFATSEQGAVAAAKLHRPDLITADVRLAPGSGVQAVTAICAEGHIPTVFITATAADVHKHFPGYSIVHKPFGADEVVEAARLAKQQTD